MAERFGGAPGCVTFVQGDYTEVWWCPYKLLHFLAYKHGGDEGDCPLCGYSRRDQHTFICTVRPPK